MERDEPDTHGENDMTDAHDPIADYLARLERAAAELPDDVAAELVTDIRAHLDEVRHHDPGDARARQALDDLGTPETVVAAARAELVPDEAGAPVAPPAPPMAPRGGIGREILAFVLAVPGPVVAVVLARTVGGTAGSAPATLVLPPLLVLLAGWVLVWTSRWWNAGDKALATALWPFGFLLPLALWLVPTQTCTTMNGQEICEGFALAPAVGIGLFIALIVLVLGGTAWLFARASRRASDPGTAHARTTEQHAGSR
ncbi:MAG: hypothetical protein JJT89_15435 [Nitriliruptoraceae bacterium]|nr:hypothetical protein [Nitriliruptoraceae bacterium]